MSLDRSKLQNVRPDSDGFQCACPACRAAGRDSQGNHLHVFKSGRWNCVVDNDPEHNRAIWALAGDGSGEYVPQEEELPQIEVERTWPLDILDRLIQDTSYWNRRGISDETLAPFRGGVATIGQMVNRYVFPVFNESGAIIGFDGRRVDGKTDKPWKIIGPSSHFIWGGLDEIADRVILTESIGDSLMLRECDVPESLCLFGVNMSQAVLSWLIAHNPRQIVISTNRDDHGVGQRAAEKIRTTLLKFFDADRVSILHPPEGVKDWGKADAAQIHAAFSDIPLDTEPKV